MSQMTVDSRSIHYESSLSARKNETPSEMETKLASEVQQRLQTRQPAEIEASSVSVPQEGRSNSAANTPSPSVVEAGTGSRMDIFA